MGKTFEEQQFETLQTAEEYIVKLINGINICIGYIEGGKYEGAYTLITYIIDGIDWLNDVARLTKNIQKQNMDEEVMKEYEKILYQYLEVENYKGIVEFFNNDMLTLLRNWEYIIKKSIIY